AEVLVVVARGVRDQLAERAYRVHARAVVRQHDDLELVGAQLPRERGHQNPGSARSETPPEAYAVRRAAPSSVAISIASNTTSGPAARRAVSPSLGRRGNCVVSTTSGIGPRAART